MSNIIIVESQPVICERITHFLAVEGYITTCYSNCSDVLKELECTDSHKDLMIIAWDIVGEMSGSELLLRLQQKQVNFPIIVITSNISLDIRNRVMSLGATDILLKPIDGDRLRRAVYEALKDPIVDPLVLELRKTLIGESHVFIESIIKLAQAIQTGNTNVLLIGDSGVGKEIFARLLHEKCKPEGTELTGVNITWFIIITHRKRTFWA